MYSGRHSLVLTADDFNLLADHEPALAEQAPSGYARELKDFQIVAAAAHFPRLCFGRLLQGPGGRQ